LHIAHRHELARLIFSGSNIKASRQFVSDKIKTEPGTSTENNESVGTFAKYGKEARTRTKSG